MNITLCINYTCPKRGNCLRYLSPGSSEMQAFGDFEYDPKKGCDFFLDSSGWNRLQLLSVQDADKRSKRKS